MTTVNSSKAPEYKGTKKLIIGIVFGVITFWLFAQAMVNVVPAVQEDLGIELGTLNIAISLSALFSGIFIVAAGGLADVLGRKKINVYWTYIKYSRFVMFGFCKRSSITHYRKSNPRFIGGMYYACDYCISQSIL